MKKTDLVDVNKQYIREKVKKSGIKYVDLSKILGLPNKGSLTGMISAERISLEYLKKISRICDFSYEDALRNSKPKAYIIKHPKDFNIETKLNEIVNMQKQINDSLIKILKECEGKKWLKK